MKWSILNKKTVYQGFFKLLCFELRHDLFGGGSSPVLKRELIEKGDAVALLPYDPRRDEVVLVEQFRIGACGDKTGPWLIEVIAGYQEPGESTQSVAIREAQEEAGCIISQLTPVARYYSSPGGTSEQIHLFVACTDSTDIQGVHGLDEEGEDIKVHVVGSAQAFDWLDTGRIDSATPIIALQWFRRHRERLRREWLR